MNSKKPNKKSGKSSYGMLKFLFKHKWYIIIMIALIVSIPSLDALLNFWVQKIFNIAEPGIELIRVYRIIIAGFLVWILKKIMYYIFAVLKIRIICNAKQDVKHNMFVSLMGLDTSNISGIASSGEYISVFTNDISLLESRFYDATISLVSDVVSIIILGSSFVALNMKLGGFVIGFGVLTLLVPIIFSKKLNTTSLNYSNEMSRFTQKTKEYVTAYPTIKNYAIEESIAGKFNSINKDVENSKFEADNMLVLANNTASMLSWFMQFFAIGLGIILVVNGEILLGTVVAAKSFASSLADPLGNIIYDINAIKSVKDVVKRLKKLSCIDENEEQHVSQKMKEQLSMTGEIIFDDVYLQVGGNTLVNHFSFKFESGKKYLMVGLNGSGKSSLFKTLKKWYGNCLGHITIDGVDLSEISNEDLSHKVSYMNENVSFFSGTVRENIALFREYNANYFQQAVADAQMRLSLDREIKDEGRNISSGEQRRIEIARSLLASVQTLIFDEVVSTLDIETAYEIEKLALGFDDKTVIFVSHNFSGKLIRQYDEILVMDNGQLLAHGKYNDLIEKCDYFRKICEIKFGKIR